MRTKKLARYRAFWFMKERRHSNVSLWLSKEGNTNINSIHNSKKSKCEFCDKSFSKKKIIKVSGSFLTKALYIGAKSLKCEFCDKLFSQSVSVAKKSCPK